ncbi:MAG: 4-hydroxybenzoate octaprenyltransferase [Devosia sp.]
MPDAQPGNWVDQFAPGWLRPYARLARWDRPIGFWLLFWPCAYATALAALAEPSRSFGWVNVLLMFMGAIVMRGAGCTLNDIIDTDIDSKVERTRNRPIPAGDVTRRQAALFLLVQLLVGLLILITFNLTTIVLGAASLVLVVTYPFMKRITWWPQLFLGLAFSWGALLGWTAQNWTLGMPVALLYAGSVLWVIGYDTIYALQDVEDDALVGVKSTARLFGARVKPIVGLFYAATLACWLAAGLLSGGGLVLVLLMIVPALMLAWQVMTLDGSVPGNALARFRANNWVGLALTLAVLIERWL